MMSTGKFTVEKKNQTFLIVEGALAGVMFSLGTGNFLVGYLNYMGASAAFCALIVALPQLGCVLQILSPFLFERLQKRKGVIIFFCFLFRFSIGACAFLPLIFTSMRMRLGTMFLVYFIAFLAAGFVTPGLNNWIMTAAPMHLRGSFFAKKDIAASVCNALLAIAMGRALDWFIVKEQAATGYFMIFSTSLVLACVDVFLLLGIEEKECDKPIKLTVRQMLEPLQEGSFRRIILFLSLHSFFFNFSTPFLAVYQLKSLKLSHGFLGIMGAGAAILGIFGSWAWGRVADKYSWNKVICGTGIGIAIGYLGWSFARPGSAWLLAPLMHCVVMSCVSSFNIAGLNLQYFMSRDKRTIAFLGMTAAIVNLCGYGAVLVSSVLQRRLELRLGFGSISVLLFISAVGMLCNALSFWRKGVTVHR